MAFRKLNQITPVSALSLIGVMVLVFGLFIAVVGSQQQQDQRSRASGPAVGDQVGPTLSLDSRSTATQTISGLQAGAKYKIVMSGAVEYDTDQTVANQLHFDSMWSDAGAVARNCYCVEGNIVSVNGWRGSLRDLVEPATYRSQHNPSHVYEFHNFPISDTSTPTALTFQIHDSNYSDNRGSITVQVYLQQLPPVTNKPPVANAGPDKTINLPTNSVSLTGTGTDEDGTITAYKWTKVSGPAGETIVSPTSATTMINGLVLGSYVFQLEVTDNNDAKHTDAVTVTVAPTGNKNPVANAGPDKTISLPTNTVSLVGSATDEDGTITAYKWTKLSGPSGETIVNPTSATTAINGLVEGSYVFEFEVTDNNGGKSTDAVLVKVNPALLTKFSFDLFLHGIGKAGDSANPNGEGNMNLVHFQRLVTVDVFDSQNQLVLTKEGLITFNTTSGSFKGTVDMGTDLASGVYIVKAKLLQSLKAQIPGIQVITAGVVNPMPQTTLINGDVNNDNSINILDYDILLGCYSDFEVAENCNAAKKIQSDITDDGFVNQFDYNLFLREMSNVGGN